MQSLKQVWSPPPPPSFRYPYWVNFCWLRFVRLVLCPAIRLFNLFERQTCWDQINTIMQRSIRVVFEAHVIGSRPVFKTPAFESLMKLKHLRSHLSSRASVAKPVLFIWVCQFFFFKDNYKWSLLCLCQKFSGKIWLSRNNFFHEFISYNLYCKDRCLRGPYKRTYSAVLHHLLRVTE